MSSIHGLSRLLSLTANEPDRRKCLDILAQSALDMTGSRVAMIALMNDELGCLVLEHGAGTEFEQTARGKQLNLAVDGEEGIVAYVAATGKGFHSGDVQNEPLYRKLFALTSSEVAMPIRDRFGRIRAVLNIESDKIDAYDDTTWEICGAISHLVAIVLDRDELHQREQALVEIGALSQLVTSEDSFLQRVIQVTDDVLRFQACSIFLLDPVTEMFVLRGSVGWRRDRMGAVQYAKGEGFTGWVCESGEPILLDSPQNDPRWRGKFTEFPSEEIASFLAVPIVSRGQSIGAIRVLRRKAENKFLDNRFTENDLRIVQAVASEIASGLENLRNTSLIVRSERMIAWGELSAKSSHMIGNRVFALKGDINEMLHVLNETVPNLDELRDLQKSLSTNVVRIEEILQDFRDFLTATQLNKSASDVNSILTETVDEVFPKRSTIQLDLELAPDLPAISVDEKRLRRAFSELIENSLNYMTEGTLCLRTLLEDRYVRIEVEDSGPGIDIDQKNRIFQPFFSNRVKGMGLGLSIVKGIVDAHGGRIFEEGSLGVGAKFVILLPIEKEKAQP